VLVTVTVYVPAAKPVRFCKVDGPSLHANVYEPAGTGVIFIAPLLCPQVGCVVVALALNAQHDCVVTFTTSLWLVQPAVSAIVKVYAVGGGQTVGCSVLLLVIFAVGLQVILPVYDTSGSSKVIFQPENEPTPKPAAEVIRISIFQTPLALQPAMLLKG
jgi:hypothetical protein